MREDGRLWLDLGRREEAQGAPLVSKGLAASVLAWYVVFRSLIGGALTLCFDSTRASGGDRGVRETGAQNHKAMRLGESLEEEEEERSLTGNANSSVERTTPPHILLLMVM
jgi:hypothetical protein